MAKTETEIIKNLRDSIKEATSSVSKLSDSFYDIFKLLRKTDKMFRDVSKDSKKSRDDMMSSWTEWYSDLQKVSSFIKKDQKDQIKYLREIGLKSYGKSINQVTMPYRGTGLISEDGKGPELFAQMESTQRDINHIEGNYLDFVSTVLNHSHNISTSQRRLFEATRDSLLDQLDALKKNEGIPSRLLTQLRKNTTEREKAEAELKKVNDTIIGISEGTVKATREDFEKLSDEKKKLKSDQKKYAEEPSKGFFSSFSRTLLNRGGWLDTEGIRKFIYSDRQDKKSAQDATSRYEDELSKIEKEHKEGKITDAQYKEQSKAINENILAVKQSSDAIRSSNLTDFIAKEAGDLFEELGKLAAEQIAKLFKDAWNKIKDVAQYSTTTSLVSNSSIREQQLRYGLSERQNYAFTQASQLMGIRSDEDLFWMNANQRQVFQELMQKETAIYNEMISSGTLERFQEMQIEFSVMKQEFTADIVKFFSENKDTILGFMKLSIQFLEAIMKIVNGILKVVSAPSKLFGLGNDSVDPGFIYHDVSAKEIEAYKNSGISTESNRYATSNSAAQGKSQTFNVTVNATGNNNSELANGISDRVRMAIMNYANS